MDEITSSEFRRTYSKVRKPCHVTVNGHPIGTWIPVGELSTLSMGETDGPTYSGVGLIRQEPNDIHLPGAHGVAMTTFRPVPKPSQRKHR